MKVEQISQISDFIVIHTTINYDLISDNGHCLGWREGPNKPYMWQTYNETLLRAKNFGSGLICQGLVPGQNTFVGKLIMSLRMY